MGYVDSEVNASLPCDTPNTTKYVITVALLTDTTLSQFKV